MMIQDNQLLSISEQIRSIRLKKSMSLKHLAEACGLSSAMLSKVENRRTIPSLSTLISIANALGVELTELLKNIPTVSSKPYFLIRKDKKKKITKEDSAHFDIGFIHSLSLQHFQHLEINHISISPGSRRKKVKTEGSQYIYCLKGDLTFEIGGESLFLSAGDTLFFDGSISHVPKNNGQSESEFLVIYLLK